MKIILGSSSIFRKKILEKAGIDFDIISADIDEKKIRSAKNELIPLLLSYAKSQAVATKIDSPSIIIACDQIVVCNERVLEKPISNDEVKEWYDMYSKHRVNFINGITVYNTETKNSLSSLETSTSSFEKIQDEFIKKQIEEGIIFSCSGAIDEAVQNTYGTIESGSEDSIIGLPLPLALDMIEKIK